MGNFLVHSDWIFEHSIPHDLHDLHSSIPAPQSGESGWTASGDGALGLLKALWHQGDMPNGGGSSGLATSQLALLHPSAQVSGVDPSPQAASLTITSNALTVTEGGSVGLPISVSPAAQGDPLFVTIKGLTNYETLTDGLDNHVFSGNTVTLTAAEVASGLTLTSHYMGPDHPVNTLSVTATELTGQQVVTSAAQTITVTDPPASGSSTSTGTGSTGNPLTLVVTGDNLNGTDPQFQVLVDGHQVGGTYTVTADHASGQTQTITINGNFDPTLAHQVQIKFINDAWDGKSWWTNGTAPDGHDVNLYVESISLNGATMTGVHGTNNATNGIAPAANAHEAVMDVNGTLSFNVPADPPATTGTVTGGTVNTGSGGSGTSSGTVNTGSGGSGTSSGTVNTGSGGSGTSSGTVNTTATGSGAPPSGPGFFVSPNGNDSNPGTVDAPFATLHRAQQAMEHSSIKQTYVEGGTYHLTGTLTLTSADNGETWTYYPPSGVHTAIIDGGGIGDIIDVQGSNITINGLQAQHSTNAGITVEGHNHNGGFNATNDTIENCVVHDISNANGSAIGSWGATNVKIFNNVIYNTTSKAISAEATQSGDLYSGTDIENNVILNSVTTVSDNGAIYLQDLNGGASTNIIIKNNFIRDFGSAARFTKGIYLDDGASNTTITGNIISGSGDFAFQYHGGDHNVVSGNIIDLGSAGNQFIGFYQMSPSETINNMAGNTFTDNVIIGAGGSRVQSWQTNIGGQALPTDSNNVYHSYGSGGISTGAAGISDSHPIFENPQLSGWTYTTATGSPVQIAGGWGPPGYIIPETGTAPSV